MHTLGCQTVVANHLHETDEGSYLDYNASLLLKTDLSYHPHIYYRCEYEIHKSFAGNCYQSMVIRLFQQQQAHRSVVDKSVQYRLYSDISRFL